MDTPMGSMNTPSATDSGTGTCAHCGKPTNSAGASHGLEQFLGKVGISDDMIKNLRTQFQDVDVEQYLNTAREYLKGNGGKAQQYAKENPGKIAAGVAVLAIGAGLLINAMNKD